MKVYDTCILICEPRTHGRYNYQLAIASAARYGLPAVHTIVKPGYILRLNSSDRYKIEPSVVYGSRMGTDSSEQKMNSDEQERTTHWGFVLPTAVARNYRKFGYSAAMLANSVGLKESS